jgi:hypothetical protein
MGLKGSKSMLTFFSLPSSVMIVPQYSTKPLSGTVAICRREFVSGGREREERKGCPRATTRTARVKLQALLHRRNGAEHRQPVHARLDVRGGAVFVGQHLGGARNLTASNGMVKKMVGKIMQRHSSTSAGGHKTRRKLMDSNLILGRQNQRNHRRAVAAFATGWIVQARSSNEKTDNH